MLSRNIFIGFTHPTFGFKIIETSIGKKYNKLGYKIEKIIFEECKLLFGFTVAVVIFKMVNEQIISVVSISDYVETNNINFTSLKQQTNLALQKIYTQYNVDFEGEEFRISKESERHLISNHGRLYSLDNQKFLTPIRHNQGYIQYSLSRKLRFLAHRMVANNFLPNDDNLRYVNHINRNKKDNKIQNLEWATPSENNYHRYSTSQYRNLSDTMVSLPELSRFKQIEGYENYYISKNGEVYNAKRNKFLTGSPNPKGHYQVGLLAKSGGYQKQLLIHRLVALHFLDNPENKSQVNHINGIKSDNKLDNLEWATNKENSIHRHETGLQDRHNKKTIWVRIIATNEELCLRDASMKMKFPYTSFWHHRKLGQEVVWLAKHGCVLIKKTEVSATPI